MNALIGVLFLLATIAGSIQLMMNDHATLTPYAQASVRDSGGMEGMSARRDVSRPDPTNL